MAGSTASATGCCRTLACAFRRRRSSLPATWRRARPSTQNDRSRPTEDVAPGGSPAAGGRERPPEGTHVDVRSERGTARPGKSLLAFTVPWVLPDRVASAVLDKRRPPMVGAEPCYHVASPPGWRPTCSISAPAALGASAVRAGTQSRHAHRRQKAKNGSDQARYALSATPIQPAPRNHGAARGQSFGTQAQMITPTAARGLQ